MDERVTSPAALITATAESSPPLVAYSLLPYTLKQEIYDSSEQEEEINPLEQEEEITQIDHEFHSLEPEKDFILTFESLPVLWDPKNPHYTNKYKRTKALAKLLPILKNIKPNATIDDVKRKINSIRSNYRRELRKIITSQQPGSKEVYKPKIWYFSYLKFLRNLEQRVPARKNESELDEVNSQRLNEISQVGTSFSSVIIPQTSYRTKKEENEGQITDDPSSSSPKIFNESCQSKKISNHIVFEWVDTLEKLDPLQRLYAKKAINDILFEAELGNLNKHSVRINEPIPNLTSSSPACSSTLKSPPPPFSP